MDDVEDPNSKSKLHSISRSRNHKSRSRLSNHLKTRSRSLSRQPNHGGSKNKNRSRHISYSKSRSRSRSCSGDSRLDRYHDSCSRRSRYYENPKPNKCLGIFGLSENTTENRLLDVFAKYNSVDKIVIIIDSKSGKSRGFGFAYFKKHEDAKAAKEEFSGMEIDGRIVRIDFSITRRPHTPTPGIYMGRPIMRGKMESFKRRGYDKYDHHRYDRGDHYDRYYRNRDYDDHYGIQVQSTYRGGIGRERGHYREHRSPSYYKNKSHYARL